MLSIYTSNSACAFVTSSARPSVSSRPNRLSVSSQAKAAPTLLVTNARASKRAASASDSGEASGGSSIVPSLAVSAFAVGGKEDGSVNGSNIDDAGCDSVRRGRCREKNWCSFRSWELTGRWTGRGVKLKPAEDVFNVLVSPFDDGPDCVEAASSTTPALFVGSALVEDVSTSALFALFACVSGFAALKYPAAAGFRVDGICSTYHRQRPEVCRERWHGVHRQSRRRQR